MMTTWIKILKLKGEVINLIFDAPVGAEDWDNTYGFYRNINHLGYVDIHINIGIHKDEVRLEKTIIHELLHVKQMRFLDVVDCLDEQLTKCENAMLSGGIERFTEQTAEILYNMNTFS